MWQTHTEQVLLIAMGFNKALQSPWFALAELIDAFRGMVKQFTEIQTQDIPLTQSEECCQDLNKKEPYSCDQRATLAKQKYVEQPII